MSTATGEAVGAFIERWARSGAAERANYQLFLSELCDALDVPRPDPAVPDETANTSVFERTVTFDNGDGTTSTGRIDLYRRGAFVLEAKQGREADTPPAIPLGPAPKLRKRTAVRGTRDASSVELAGRLDAALAGNERNESKE